MDLVDPRHRIQAPAAVTVAFVSSVAGAQVCSPQTDRFTGPAPEQQFGHAVALSRDGRTAMVSAWVDNGTVGAFVREPGGWVRQGPMLFPDGSAGVGQHFGRSLSLSADGDTALIGASGDPGFGGAAYVFTRSDGVWSQGPKLGANGGLFGTSVALSANGQTALIGAVFDEYPGSAYVFTRSGRVWTKQGPKLTPTGSVWASHFGGAVALSADGETALIGAYRDAQYIGAAYAFVRVGEQWVQQGPKIVVPSVPGPAQYFGRAVALSADGNTALVGVPANNVNLGAVHVFVRAGGVWTAQGPKLVPTGNQGLWAQFGRSIAVSDSGDRAIIGAISDNAAYVFVRTAGLWAQRARIKPAGLGNPAYGYGVAMSGDGTSALAGAPHDNMSTGAASFLDLHCVLCYPDCDEDGRLGASDFGCFQARFAAGEPYADCNGDGQRTVVDFGCFQTRFVTGCP